LELPAVAGELVSRVLHCCYGGQWQALVGGLMGVDEVVKSKEVPVEFLQEREATMVRALLHILRRLPDHAQLHASRVEGILASLLNKCRPNAAPEAPQTAVAQQQLGALVRVLAEELFSITSTPPARRATESSLELLAKLTCTPVAQLLEPCYVPLLPALLNRPLQAKPLEAQMETIGALTFVLGLNPPLLKMTEDPAAKLQDLLTEALKVAEANYDEPGVALKIPNFPLHSRAVMQTQLRTACIELLLTAMASNKVKCLAQGDLRTMTIAMFFKSLTCKTPEIVAASKKGLQQVISQQKLPKDLLQSSLRPILGPICAHHKHLSLPLLQGLARLLELLSNWFNVTLGEKLIDHLNKWLEPEKLAQARNSWKPGEEAKIADSLINLFHLLPPMAHKFLDELVVLSIKLEGVLPSMGCSSELCSPYRASVTRYLCTYKTQAVDYFLAPDKLATPAYYFRFRSMLKQDVGKPLRDELADNPEKLVVAAFGGPTAWQSAQTLAAMRAKLVKAQTAAGAEGAPPSAAQHVTQAQQVSLVESALQSWCSCRIAQMILNPFCPGGTWKQIIVMCRIQIPRYIIL